MSTHHRCPPSLPASAARSPYNQNLRTSSKTWRSWSIFSVDDPEAGLLRKGVAMHLLYELLFQDERPKISSQPNAHAVFRRYILNFFTRVLCAPATPLLKGSLFFSF